MTKRETDVDRERETDRDRDRDREKKKSDKAINVHSAKFRSVQRSYI